MTLLDDQQPVWQLKGVSELDIGQVVQKLSTALKQQDRFVLWLVGPVGAGKTTLVRYLLRHWGLPEKIPVTSPTFTYLNNYEFSDRTFGHLDLYRAESDFELTDLGIGDVKDYNGLFLEWPEQVPKHPIISPSHILDIAYTDTFTVRDYALRGV